MIENRILPDIQEYNKEAGPRRFSFKELEQHKRAQGKEAVIDLFSHNEVLIIFTSSEFLHNTFTPQMVIDPDKLKRAKDMIDEPVKCFYFFNDRGSLRFVIGDGHHRALRLYETHLPVTASVCGAWQGGAPLIPFKQFHHQHGGDFVGIEQANNVS